MSCSKERRSGFILLESLTAFMILTLFLGGLYRSVAGGARNEDRADFLLRASSLGHSLIEAVGITAPLSLGATESGSSSDLRWVWTTEPYRISQPFSGVQKTVAFWVRLTIHKNGMGPNPPQTLTFITVKLAPVVEARP